MSLAQSTKKHDAGHILGAASVPQCVEIVLLWTGANSRIFHTNLHGSYSGTLAVNVALANSLFSAISSSWSTNLASFSPTGTNMLRVALRDMSSAANPVYLSTAAAVAGTSASPAMPPNVALVLTEQVAARGRGAKGRIFVPNWATNADASGGLAAGAVQTAMNAWGTGIFNAISGQSLVPCVAKVARQAYIGYAGASHAARAAATLGVTGYICQDLFWDSQRPRIKP